MWYVGWRIWACFEDEDNSDTGWNWGFVVLNCSIFVCLIRVVLRLGRWDSVLHCPFRGWRKLGSIGGRVKHCQFEIQVSRFCLWIVYEKCNRSRAHGLMWWS